MAEYTYKTIVQPSEGLFKDKGSKFLAFAFPVVSENEVKSHLEQLRKEHHAARHHCWAYKLGNRGEQYRCSDDGEPSNSAGKPILGQLDAFSVTNVLVVVVRYFGGILLGVGGLMQAYKEATKDALSHANIEEREVTMCYSLQFRYEQNNAVNQILKKYKCNVLTQEYTADCKLKFSISEQYAQTCVESLQILENVCVTNEN